MRDILQVVSVSPPKRLHMRKAARLVSWLEDVVVHFIRADQVTVGAVVGSATSVT